MRPGARRAFGLAVVVALSAVACSTSDATTTTTEPPPGSTAATTVPAATSTSAAPATTSTVPSTTTTTTTAPTTTATETTTSTAPTGSVVAVEDRRRSDDPAYEVDVIMPQLTGFADTAVEAAINTAIAAHYASVRDPFLEFLIADLTEYPPDPSLPVSTFGMGYEVVLLTGDVLSLRVDVGSYTSGAANISTDVAALVFDLRSGERLTTVDLLGGDAAVGELSSVVRMLLIRDYYEGVADDFAGWEGAASPENLTDVLVAPDGIEVWFGRYEAGPGAFGDMRVTVPYADLEGLLGPGAAVAGLLAGD